MANVKVIEVKNEVKVIQPITKVQVVEEVSKITTVMNVNRVSVVEQNNVIRVMRTGSQGVPGPQGPQGIPGPISHVEVMNYFVTLDAAMIAAKEIPLALAPISGVVFLFLGNGLKCNSRTDYTLDTSTNKIKWGGLRLSSILRVGDSLEVNYFIAEQR